MTREQANRKMDEFDRLEAAARRKFDRELANAIREEAVEFWRSYIYGKR